MGKQPDEKIAKHIGRDSQRLNTVNLDKKAGKARVSYENSKIQDLTERSKNEILDAVNGEKKLNSRPFNKVVKRSSDLDSRLVSKTAGKDNLTVEEKLARLSKAAKNQVKLLGRQFRLEKLEEKAANNKLKKERNIKNLKKVGKAAGTAILGGAAIYGAKKLYDKKKEKEG